MKAIITVTLETGEIPICRKFFVGPRPKRTRSDGTTDPYTFEEVLREFEDWRYLQGSSQYLCTTPAVVISGIERMMEELASYILQLKEFPLEEMHQIREEHEGWKP